jgi:hypothetical protein
MLVFGVDTQGLAHGCELHQEEHSSTVLIEERCNVIPKSIFDPRPYEHKKMMTLKSEGVDCGSKWTRSLLDHLAIISSVPGIVTEIGYI